MTTHGPTLIDASTSTRKVLKRRKIELPVLPSESSMHTTLDSPLDAPSRSNELRPDPQTNSIQTTCSSCHRAVLRIGSLSTGPGTISCARYVSSCFPKHVWVWCFRAGLADNFFRSCCKLTCVICSRKCDGPLMLLSTSPQASSESRRYPLGPVHHTRKTLPARRLPPLTNNARTNENDYDMRCYTLSSSQQLDSGKSYSGKHGLTAGSLDTLSDPCTMSDTDGCPSGTDAIFCKNCVTEDIERYDLSNKNHRL
jgi:hypothetical protein